MEPLCSSYGGREFNFLIDMIGPLALDSLWLISTHKSFP